MTRSQLLAALLMVAVSTGAIAAPAYTVISNAANAPKVVVKAKAKKAKKPVKKAASPKDAQKQADESGKDKFKVK